MSYYIVHREDQSLEDNITAQDRMLWQAFSKNWTLDGVRLWTHETVEQNLYEMIPSWKVKRRLPVVLFWMT